MYSIIIENTVRPGKKPEFLGVWTNDILPLLKKQPGFVDACVLTGSADPSLIVGINFWKTEADAERYYTQVFPEIAASVSHLFEFSPIVRTFAVEASEALHIATRKAA